MPYHTTSQQSAVNTSFRITLTLNIGDTELKFNVLCKAEVACVDCTLLKYAHDKPHV